jgi:hypothetical protein
MDAWKNWRVRANTRVTARDLKLRRCDIIPGGLEEGTLVF